MPGFHSCFSLPQDKLEQLLKQSVVTELDFSGLDQLTDEAFFVLKESFKPGTKQQDAVQCVKCVGCVHITDFGVLQIAQTFPALQKVRFDFSRQCGD